MQLKLFHCLVLTVAAILISQHSNAQGGTLKLTGIVYDSLTKLPLPFVTVVNQKANTGVSTDENGSFTINCLKGDSILFTILGYSKKYRIADSDEPVMIVFLREIGFSLKPITVYGSFKPQGSDYWKKSVEKPRTFQNFAGPGSGHVVETVGVGVSVGGLISHFSKGEKEKRKLKTDREKAKQSETFLSVIVSEDTKAFFQKTFSLSESDYSKFIEAFNIAHPEAVYMERKEDIINLMVGFMATRKK